MNRIILSWALLLSVLAVSPVFAVESDATAITPTEQIRDLSPDLPKDEAAAIKKFYATSSNRFFPRSILYELRRKQLSDPLDQQTHEIILRSPEFSTVVLETYQQVRAFIQESYISHLGGATLAKAGKGDEGQLQELLKQMKQIKDTGLYLFPEDAQLRVFARQGEINAYTWSGDYNYLDMTWFDGLLDATEKHLGARYEIGGHELGHIFFKHIPQRIALNLIFYSVAKNLIPEEQPNSSDLPDAKDDKKKEGEPKKSVSARLDALDQKALLVWKTRLAREIVPHVGAVADRDPAFIVKVIKTLDAQADALTAKLGKEGVELKAAEFYRAAMGLGANENVVITKDMEKKFEEALQRLGRSNETSCDNIGRVVTELLMENSEAAREGSTRAFIALFGSKYAGYKATLSQIEEYLAAIGSETGRAFRDVGSSHPNIVARAAAMYKFADHHNEPFRILTNPFLTLVADYLTISEKIVALDRTAKAPEARELLDRQVDASKLDSMKKIAAEMSDLIEGTVVREVVAAEKAGKSDARLVALVVVLNALERSVARGEQSTSLVSENDIRLDLGRPGRLAFELVEKLKKAQSELTSKGVVKVGASGPSYLERAVAALSNLIPLSQAAKYKDFLGSNCGIKVATVAKN